MTGWGRVAIEILARCSDRLTELLCSVSEVAGKPQRNCCCSSLAVDSCDERLYEPTGCCLGV